MEFDAFTFYDLHLHFSLSVGLLLLFNVVSFIRSRFFFHFVLLPKFSFYTSLRFFSFFFPFLLFLDITVIFVSSVYFFLFLHFRFLFSFSLSFFVLSPLHHPRYLLQFSLICIYSTFMVVFVFVSLQH